MIPLTWITGLSMLLFAAGVFGLLMQKSALRVLIAVELILNAAGINFVAFAHYHT